jgi:hypothetical protein
VSGEQVVFQRRRLVVVDELPLRLGHSGAISVVAVVLDDRDAVTELALDPLRERGLAAPRAAGDADEEGTEAGRVARHHARLL